MRYHVSPRPSRLLPRWVLRRRALLACFLVAHLSLTLSHSVSPSHPSLSLPPGVQYDPLVGLQVERVRAVKSGSPAAADQSGSTEQGDVDGATLLRAMQMYVPGDDLLPSMPALSHHVHRTGGGDLVTAMRQSTETLHVRGSKSTFVVVLDSSMPMEARASVEAALRAWSDVFPSAVPVRVRYSWSQLAEGVLGATGVSFYVQGSTAGADKLDDQTVYSAAVAAAIQGKDFVPEGEFHIVMGFSSVAPWHFGIDAAPADKYDLQTVMMHEVCHGLFFAGLVQGSSRQGLANFVYRDNRPARFDRFLASASGEGLCMCKPPGEIYGAVTSKVRFFDPMDPGTDFHLFAPRQFTPGSSTYHLDDNMLSADCKRLAIPEQECSDLLTHSLNKGYTRRVIGTPLVRILNSILRGTGGFSSNQSCAT